MEIQALDFLGDYARFEKTYLRYRRKRNQKDLDYLYEHVKSNFYKWELVILSRDYKQDLTVYTLMCLLDKDSKTPMPLEKLISMFESWMSSMGLTWFDIWTEAFILHMAKLLRISYSFQTPRHLAYLMSRDIKMLVYAKVRNIYFLVKRDITFSSRKKKELYYFEENTYEDFYFDNEAYLEYLANDTKMFKIFMSALFNKKLTSKEFKPLCLSINQKLLSNLEITQIQQTSNL